MKTYVINLKRCPDRRRYMDELLKNYPFLDVEYIDAVDGRQLSEDEKNKRFNSAKAFELYGKNLSSGEIGCTLSHQECYKRIAHGTEEFALILEDDLIINKTPHLEYIITNAVKKTSSKPTAILLSGDYYWFRKQKYCSSHFIAHVFDASCTQAYMINKEGARALSCDRPYFLADDWELFSNKIKLCAIFPHLTDQNRDSFDTEVIADHIGIIKKNLSARRNLHYLKVALIKKVLIFTGHFERKDFRYKK